MSRFVCFIILLFVFSSCRNDVDFEASDPVYKTGDSLQWAAAQYNDAAWKAGRPNAGNQVGWARSRVQVISKRPAIGPLGLQVHAFGAFDVYWDGKFVGNNGHPALNGKAEIPGTESSNFLLPDSLSNVGKHVLALRRTLWYEQDEQRSVDVKLEGYQLLIESPLIIMSFMNMMAGAFLIAAFYYLVVFINSSRKQYAILIFGIICFLFFSLLILEYIKFYITIPYTHFYVRLQAIGFLTFAIALLVPLYFTIQFDFKYKRIFSGVLLLTLIAIYFINFRHYDLTARCFSYTMWIASLLVVVNALVRKVKGGWVVLLGLLVSAAINAYLLYDFGLFICFTIIVLCMMYLHTIRATMIEKDHEVSVLLSSRLKLELLKKNIQPHFIKNTLTSLIDWIEESPREGSVFIQALAKEFDILNEIAEATLIPVSTEIELCKTHLKVMQFRKEIQYDWEQSGIDNADLVPPAIFHTVLENGITHSMPMEDGSIRFALTFAREHRSKTYTLRTFAQNRVPLRDKKTGTGFQYIVARLQESYGDGWEFHSAASADGWITTIKIKERP